MSKTILSKTPIKWLKIFSYAFLGIVGLLFMVVALAFSSFGINFLVGIANQNEAVTIEGVSGSLYSKVAITNLNIDIPAVTVQAENINIDLGLNCFFVGEACIDAINISQMVMILKSTEETNEPESEPADNYIKLPLPFNLSKLNISRLSVFNEHNNQEVAPLVDSRNLELELSFFKHLHINKLSLQSIDILQAEQSETEQNVQQQNFNQQLDKLLLAANNFEYAGIDIPQVFVPINLKALDAYISRICSVQNVPSFKHEELNEKLQKTDFSQEFDDSVCTINTTLNASLMNQKAKLSLSTEPVELKVGLIKADFKIDLPNQFSHEVTVDIFPNTKQLKQAPSPLVFKMQGNIEQFQFTLKQKENAKSANKPVIEAEFAGDVTKDNLPVSLHLSAERLSEITESWLVTSLDPLSSFTFIIDGDTRSYDINGEFELLTNESTSIKMQGTASLLNKIVEIREISTSGDIGTFNANGNVSISKAKESRDLVSKDETLGVNINTKLSFKDFTVQALTQELQSNLNGELKLESRISSETKSFSLLCKDIEGMLQNYYLSLICDAKLQESGILEIRKFALEQSNNSIRAKGKIVLPTDLNDFENVPQLTKSVKGINNNLAIDIGIQDLSSFHNALRGKIIGNATLEGEVLSPIVEAELNLDQLRFDQIAIDSGLLKANINATNDFETDLTLDLKVIKTEQLIANSVLLKLIGNKSDHSFDIELQHPDYSTIQELEGKIVDRNDGISWQGKWSKGLIKLGFSEFELRNKLNEKPVMMNIAKDDITIDGHCWTDILASETLGRSQELCIDELSYVDKEGRLQATFNYNFNKLLIDSLPDYFFPGTEIPIHSNISLAYNPKDGIRGLIQTLITDAKLITVEQPIDVTAVVANFSVENNLVMTSVFAGTKQTGSIGLLSTIDLEPDNRQHQGLVSINNIILAPVKRFVPTIEKIDGLIQGRLEFDGALEKPVFNGDLSISNAELAVTSYPYPIKNFNQKVSVLDNKVDVEGTFELGDGNAQYEANLNIADGLEIQGEIKGNELQIAIAEHNLEASPDIKFKLDPDNLLVSGKITIPKADINIKSLPESAKSPSNDVIILGGTKEPPALPIGLDVNVQIYIDPNKRRRVEISALDLDATLYGDLEVNVKQKKNIKENTYSPMQTLVYGSISTLSGSYEAYGQNLQIQKGTIFFNGVPNLPQFDITAIRNPLNTADNVIAGIRISGNPIMPKVDLFSEPNMIQARQLSYLLQGTDLDGGEGTSSNVLLVNALVSFGIGNSENGVNKLGQSLGFDSLNLQTAGQGENTQVQLSGRISDNIQITYGVGLFDQASELILKYQLMPQLYIEARSGATSAVDLFYEITRGD